MNGGFGGESSQGDPFDWGFGDPTAPNIGSGQTEFDLGFGSVHPAPFVPLMEGEGEVYTDDGGWLRKVAGDWPIIGPYRVLLIEAITSATFPDTSKQLGCFHGRPGDDLTKAFLKFPPVGDGSDCRTDITQVAGTPPEPSGNLLFAMPPLPPAWYHLEIKWGAFFESSTTLTYAVRIIHRARATAQWSIRSTFQDYYNNGARRSRQEQLLAGKVNDK